MAMSGLEDPQNDDFFKSSYALIFFGVPNLGLRYESLRKIVAGQPNEQLIHDLQVDNESEPTPFLRGLAQNFIQCCKLQKPSFQIISYYEQKKTKMVEASCNYVPDEEWLLTNSYRNWTTDGYRRMVHLAL
jgi:hypothetical protein